MLRVLVTTYIPSPYQVELFNWLNGEGKVHCRVAYCRRAAVDRQWALPELHHEAAFLDEAPDPHATLAKLAGDAALVVVSGYGHPAVRRLMADCEARRQTWCFWGERPGFRGYGPFGTWFRRFRLGPLYRGRAAIWGMGQWAVEGWRREFGPQRPYFNVPYFSDLARFSPTVAKPASPRRRFLFSGSLIPRKGIDLLMSAFARLAASRPSIELTILGAGPLEAELKAKGRGLEERIRFLGFRDWPDLPATYAQADVSCVPSRYDGWGLVVPEGLAAGLPVIATDQTGAALDLIKPGHNGWLTKAGDEASLFEALAEAADLSGRELRRRSAAALASVAEHGLADGARRWRAAAEASLQSHQS